MAAIGFAKTFAVCFIGILAISAGALRFIPRTRNYGWRTSLMLVFVAASIGYAQGLALVAGYAQASLEKLHRAPNDETSMRYLVGDFLPTLRQLGGSLSPEMIQEVDRIADHGTPCPAAMANRLLGKKSSVESACGSK